MSDRKARLRKVRNRLLVQSELGFAAAVVVWLGTFFMMGPSFISHRLYFTGLLLIVVALPMAFIQRRNFIEARRAVSSMWAFGPLSFEEISRSLAAGLAIRTDIQEAEPYIEVMHNQIGESLVESEREVVAVIEQIGSVNENASGQRKHIAVSVRSGHELTESTHLRVERNRQTIASIEMHLQDQINDLRNNFERMQGLSTEVLAMTPMIKVITSIAQQTNLLALNAEIEAAPGWQCRARLCCGSQ
jgi:hypothetical protein